MPLARLLPALSIALAVSACSPGDAGHEALSQLSPRPGAPVVVVSFDAMRRSALGLYGYERPTSPRLDRFAERSVVFDRAWTASPSTLYSFTAAFTGRLPSAGSSLAKTVDRSETLAEHFSTAGYATAAFLNNPWLDEPYLSAGFQHYQVFSRDADEDVMAAALAWIEAHREGSFFVWIHLLDPHSPYERRPGSAALYDPTYEGPFRDEALTYGLPFQLEDPHELARARQLYDGEVHHVDALFGRLVDRLEALGLSESTFVVATADHGEEFMEHGRLQHTQLYEEHLRIPLILRHPDLHRELRSDEPASNLDLLPTLAWLTGLPAPQGVSGRNLFEEGPAERPLPTVKSVKYKGERELGAALHEGPWKLIVECSAGRRELYDLERDPSEHDDLAEQEPERARALESDLWAAVGRKGCDDLLSWAPLSRGQHESDAEIDPKKAEALKALGYLQE